MKEPLSEDDCPEDIRIVSFPPFELGEDKLSLNYIKEGERNFFRPLNAQIENQINDKENNT